MNKNHFTRIAAELNIKVSQVETTTNLLDEGATVPFIARYRKELTGSLDDLQVAAVRDRIQQLRDLDKRREAILKSIEEQGKLTDELRKKVEGAETLAVLEDVYLPYKQKRKTRASIAKEKGLEPLAHKIIMQDTSSLEGLAQAFIDEEKGVTNVEEALAGARDIIAEQINEDPDVRRVMRAFFWSDGVVTSKVIKGKESEGHKYKDYFDWQEKISKIPSHRLLAIRRGEKEMILSVDISPEAEEAIYKLESKFVKGAGAASEQVKLAATDAYKRLLKPSMETESRLRSKTGADEEAIRVFSENLHQLLLAAPLGQKRVMAIDPGFRTGCKVVCLDEQGKLLEFQAIYPNEPQKDTTRAGASVKHMVEQYQIQAIAIGNGTASRETESFVKGLGLDPGIIVAMVNESGASIYSASAVAREEFPDEDVTVRGSVSIGRRMMDPLAELVKIDAKSIGVGQYQHDVDQNLLKKGLDDVVINCVNKVGVELNTASKELLSYVSGLGPQLAKNIVDFRNENGPFKDRKALKKVPRLGDKAYEQAAGFLRINEGVNILDRSAVHPERYGLVTKMAKDLGADVETLVKDGALRKQIKLKNYVSEEVGLPTLDDIMSELDKPGRDPRDKFEVFTFQEGVNEMQDLSIGMKLPGIVTNLTKFGAFVDIGVHQDGLVHVSHVSDSFVSDVAKAVKLQQQVMVTVLEVDIPRKRISLSMKSDPFGEVKSKSRGVAKKKREPEKSNDSDLATKLAMLKGKFGS